MPGVPATQGKTSFLDTLQYSNVYIILVAFSLATSAPVLLEQPVDLWVVLCCCTGAFLIYLLDRAVWIREEDFMNHPERVHWLASHHLFIYASVMIAAGLLATALLMLKDTVLLGYTLLGILGGIYIIPWWGQQWQPKKWGFFKVACIAGAWMVGSVTLPLLVSNEAISGKEWLFSFYRFILLAANVVLADWPDRAGDHAVGIHSVASRLGHTRMRRFAVFLCLAGLVLGGYQAFHATLTRSCGVWICSGEALCW